VEEIPQYWSAPAPEVQSMQYIAPSEQATQTRFGFVGDRQYVMTSALGRAAKSICGFMDRVRSEVEVE
jgi:hypothetical protein